jgi:HlyD family secretion protein
MVNIFKLKKTYVILVIILAAAGFGYNKYQISKLPPQYETVRVEKKTLIQSVDATGIITASDDLSLRFEIPGILSAVNVKEGSKVKVNQILATLRLAELNAALAQAQSNLNKQLAGATPDYIAQLKASLDKAKYDLTQAQGNGSDAESSKLVQNAYDDLVAQMQSLQVVLSANLTAADNILGIDNTMANDTFENNLSVVNTNYLNQAKTNFATAKTAKNDFDLSFNAITKSSSHSSIDEVENKADKAAIAMKNLLYYVALVLDNTPPIGSLTQSALDTLKTNTQTARTNLAAAYSSLITKTHAITTARNDYASYQALADKAQAALNDAKNPPREVDIASYRAALEQAIANRDKAIMKAPIDGIITLINKKVGETVNSADDLLKLLSPHYQIEVDISETDIAKVKLGDTAVVTLDAFGDDVKFSGKVFNIDPGATVIQDVVYYKVKISLDDTDKAIKPGMTANVVIKTAELSNVLIIPSRAVRSNGGKNVRILENGIEKLVEVKLGIKGDDGKAEVLSGLNEGQEVIVGSK